MLFSGKRSPEFFENKLLDVQPTGVLTNKRPPLDPLNLNAEVTNYEEKYSPVLKSKQTLRSSSKSIMCQQVVASGKMFSESSETLKSIRGSGAQSQMAQRQPGS